MRACHDLSEGGLAVALAEMAFAGDLGAAIELANVPHSIVLGPSISHHPLARSCCSRESNTRFLCEVPPWAAAAFEKRTGRACRMPASARSRQIANLEITADGHPTVGVDVARLKAAWQAPLDWS